MRNVSFNKVGSLSRILRFFYEVILLLRTWAIWRDTPWVTHVLAIWATMTLVANFVVMGLFMASIGCEHHRILVLMGDLLSSFSVSALPSGLSGCLVTSGNSLILGVWIILMVYEAGKPSCTSNNKTTSINSFYRYLTVDDIERSPNVYVEGFSWHPIFILIR